MIELTVIAAQLVVIALLVLLVGVLIIDRRDERDDHAGQLDRLLQRIQAPELAVAEHAQHAVAEWAPPAVPLDDDASHWEAKEDLAQRLAEMELKRG